MSKSVDSGRRNFLKGAGLLGVAGVGGLLHRFRSQWFLINPDSPPTVTDDPASGWANATVKAYNPLGRTGWEMSDISFGAGGLEDPEVVRIALDRGINYIDTSPDYSNSQSERAVGEAIKGRRDKVFVASKFCRPDGHLHHETSVADVMAAVEESLRRLDTDYIDLAHIHACDDLARLMAPTFHEAFDRLKEQGKVRFMGVSSHTPNLEEVMHAAVDSDRFDVIMVAYNFKNWPQLGDIIDKAAEKNVGFVAMKTLKGAYHTVLEGFEPDERNSFPQAAFKWVNGNPNVAGLVVTIKQPAQLDEYLYASGQKATAEDLVLLGKYTELAKGHYCEPGCGDCLSACPEDVAVDDVLRYAMYNDTYGREREASRLYERMIEQGGQSTDICAGCPAPCEARCPNEIPIRNKLVRADRVLRYNT